MRSPGGSPIVIKNPYQEPNQGKDNSNSMFLVVIILETITLESQFPRCQRAWSWKLLPPDGPDLSTGRVLEPVLFLTRAIFSTA